MNRRTFLKVLIGTVGAVILNPVKVLSDQAPAPEPAPEYLADSLSQFIGKPNTQENRNRIIDIVRTAYPAVIAKELCSVQPMTAPAGKVFRLERSFYIELKKHTVIEN